MARKAGPSPSRLDATTLGVIVCFVLSGFAALLYQTAWLRQFSFVFGTSELAVATVLASYMGGLAIGAAVAGRMVRRVQRPVLVYGLLELGVALGALAVPLLLAAARRLFVGMLGGQEELPESGSLQHSIFFLTASFLIIALPTSFMGATLPLLTRYAVRRPEEIGSKTGLLYAMNTAGAVLGAVVAAFVLLPRFGLQETVWVGVALNAVIFGVAAVLGRKAQRSVAEEVASARRAPTAAPEAPTYRGLILPFMLVSGAVSFTYEVVWTRLLSHVLGSSVYAFATMLASFLIGITLGSAVASRRARSFSEASVGFFIAQVGTAVLSLGVFLLSDGLPDLARWLGAGEASWSAGAVVAALVLLPSTLCIGATFPFALRILEHRPERAGSASGRLYAWNTVGAIVGSILAGFFIIPTFEFGGTLQVAVTANLAIGLAGALLWLRSRRGLAIAVPAVAFGVLLLLRPGNPAQLLQSSPFADSSRDGTKVFLRVGRAACILMLEEDGQFELRSNGLPEARIRRTGTPPFGRTFDRWLSTAPVLARPDARSMLVIGLGGGSSIEAVPPSVESIDVIELEPEVIRANEAIASLREVDPLADPRVRLFINDARGSLALTRKRYDIIVSQPSHPWTAGASHLYTREFMQQALDHLMDGGVFVQWMLTDFVDPEMLRTVAATLLDVFPSVEMYRPSPNAMIFLASPAPLDTARAFQRSGQPVASAPEFYRRLGIHDVNDILVALAVDDAGLRRLSRGAPLNTDDSNRLALGLTRTQGDDFSAELDRLILAFDPLLQPDSALLRDLGDAVRRPYLLQRLIACQLVQRAALLSEQTAGTAEQLLLTGLLFRAGGQGEEGQRRIQQAYLAAPDAPDTRFVFVQSVLPQLLRGKASATAREAAAGLQGPELAVYLGEQEAFQQRWTALAAREDELARLPASSAAYFAACRLRAEWRCHAGPETDAGTARKLGREALHRIDQALVLLPEPAAYRVRLDAAIAAEQPDAVLETASDLTRFLTSPGSAPPDLQAAIRERLRQLLPTLEAQGEAPPDRAVRRQQVIALLRSVLAEGA